MIKADNAINIHETFSPVHIKSKMHRFRKQMCCVSLGNGKFLILTPLWRILHCESSRAGIKRSNLSTTLEETQTPHIRCFRVFEKEYNLNRRRRRKLTFCKMEEFNFYSVYIVRSVLQERIQTRFSGIYLEFSQRSLSNTI